MSSNKNEGFYCTIDQKCQMGCFQEVKCTFQTFILPKQNTFKTGTKIQEKVGIKWQLGLKKSYKFKVVLHIYD